jgi:hypothetical protein
MDPLFCLVCTLEPGCYRQSHKVSRRRAKDGIIELPGLGDPLPEIPADLDSDRGKDGRLRARAVVASAEKFIGRSSNRCASIPGAL